MVGVHGMGVVGGDEEAACHGGAVLLLRSAAGVVDAVQHVIEEGRGRALLGAAADLLVVKDAADRNAVGVLCREEALHAAERAFQIVELRRGEVFVLRAEHRALFTQIEEQIVAENVVCIDARRLGGQLQEAALGVRAAEQGIGVHIRQQLHAVVGGAVHVDGNTRDDEQVAVDVHELRDDLSALTDDEPSGCGKRTVEPR